MLRLHLFGALSISLDDDEQYAPTRVSGRPGSLLAYLALAHGRFVSRAELVAALWADQSDTVGSGTFNTVLWRLRKLVERPPLEHGALIACDHGGCVGLQPRVPVMFDIDEFAQLVLPVLAKPLDRTSGQDIEALRKGIALYSADILAGLGEEWALREREKHRRHYLNALGRLVQVCTITRDHDAAIRYAQAILDHDSLREDVHRQLMQLFVDSGQRALALRQFELCRGALRRELAIHPMQETLALYRAIADHAVVPEAPSEFHDRERVAEMPTMPSARALIEAARLHIAQADAQLQRSLPLV